MIPPKKQFVWLYTFLLSIAAFFTCTTAFVYLGGSWPFEFLQLHFDLAEEHNLATWYSGMLLFTAGIAAMMNGHVIQPTTGSVFMYRILWYGFGLLLIGMSVDEIITLHEWVEDRYHQHMGPDYPIPDMFGLTDHYAGSWFILYLPIIVTSTIFIAWFIKSSSSGPRTIAVWMSAGLLLWLGSLIAEYVEVRIDMAGGERGLQAPIEEGCEVFGTTMFLIAFLEFFRAVVNNQRLPFVWRFHNHADSD